QTRHASLFDQTEWDVPPRRLREGFEVEVVDATLVRDIMTPILFTVALDTPCKQVVDQMLSLKVHHLFVVDEDGALVGVISSLAPARPPRTGCPANTPPPGPLPEAERGRETFLLPLSASGRGPGGGVQSRKRRGKIYWHRTLRRGTLQLGPAPRPHTELTD